jgi:hypothetical protein
VVGLQGLLCKFCGNGSQYVKFFIVHLVRISESCFHLFHLHHSALFIKPLFTVDARCDVSEY